MTDPNLTLLVLLVDRSGSMRAIRRGAEQGVKHLITEQRQQPGELLILMYQFDDDFAEVPDVDAWTLIPGSMTALHDALGKSITAVGRRLRALPEQNRPGKVIFQVTTDGLENASQEFGGHEVAEMIKQQTEDYGWLFLYNGANHDVITVARTLNIPVANAATFEYTGPAAAAAYATASGVISDFRNQ